MYIEVMYNVQNVHTGRPALANYLIKFALLESTSKSYIGKDFVKRLKSYPGIFLGIAPILCCVDISQLFQQKKCNVYFN